MKLTKKLQTEIWKIYDTWMQGYLNADVETYNSYFDEDYHFIGSTNNEEFLNRKDTTDFFRATGDQFAGMTDLRKETKTLEIFGEHVFLTHFFDAWFKNDEDWSYYGRFRFSSVMHNTKEGWRFIYQHFSMPDSKSEEGQTIGFDKVHLENQELREAIQRRTSELEKKNRELEVETALERIRAQAVAMKESTDLLDIVVTMRNEFIKLGHEAHYFWHMMWLPEIYEKAMTSGDGTKIGFVMKLPRHIHGDIPLLAKWEKSKKPTVVYTMNVEETINYVDKMVDLGDFQSIDPQAPTHDDIRHIGGLTFIMARTTHGEIGYSLPGVVKNPPKEDIDILVQFAGAFDLAHRRFLDLQKAEKQAREVQIELALEKVRSRTMAMQKSKELADVATVLFQQVKELGIEQWTCGFNIWESGDTEFTFYPGGPDGEILPSCKVPLMEHPIFRQFDESKRRGDELFVYEKQGEVQKDHYKYMHSLPGIGDMLQGMLDSGLEFPEYQIDHVANFAYGNMIFITYQPVPEMHGVFKRFAKVFEQTYTRFLDLQKAEVQARESQIQLALERVRAKTMAMQQSKELVETSELLFEQIKDLGIEVWSCGYSLWYDDDSYFIGYNPMPNGKMGPTFKIPLTEDIFFKTIRKAKRGGKEFLVFESKGKSLEKTYQYMDTLPVVGEAMREIVDSGFELPKFQVTHCGFFTHGHLMFITHKHYPEAHDIFKRFTKEFEQTYTRFLDLQKAEAQAREAQIEAALERVRSRSMAMHHTSELQEIIETVHNEFNTLNIDITGGVFIAINSEIQKEINCWGAGGTTNYVERVYIPFLNSKIYTGLINGIKKGPGFFTEKFSNSLKKKFFKHLFKHPPYLNTSKKHKDEVINREGGYARSCVTSENTSIFMINHHGREFTKEDNQILKRFGHVFEQSYTRFLDLQKAEAQARESEIELALERVRARTMAMQHSDELAETAALLFKQISDLGIETWTSGFNIWEKNDVSFIGYNPTPSGDITAPYQIPSTEDSFFKKIHKAKQNDEDFLMFKASGKSLANTYKYMKTLPVVKDVLQGIEDSGTQLPKSQINHSAYFSHGFLLFITLEPYPKAHDIFKRFAKVFEQTYTRFLDLQKAEAQAREAEIELALERVRARAMAIRDSAEIDEVIQLIFQELSGLELQLIECSIVTYDTNPKDLIYWSAGPHGSAKPNSVKLQYIDHPILVDLHKDLEKGVLLRSGEFSGKLLKTWWERVFTETDFKQAPIEFQESWKKVEQLFYLQIVMEHGFLEFARETPISEDQVQLLKRFTNVVDLTYTRYDDVLKAETQAREAQIEAALERVRSRSMAMHNSEEIGDVAFVLFEQLKSLGGELWGTGFGFCKKDSTVDEFWFANENGIMPHLKIPNNVDEAHKKMYQGWKKNLESFSMAKGGKELKHHYKYMLTVPDVQPIFQGILDNGISFPKWQKWHAAYFKYGYLLVITTEIYINEDVFVRFAKVFEQAYTRFLDLQKAEAQARESQIELGLERVRARAMAMQKSNELSDLVSTVMNELTKLDFALALCIINIINGKDRSNTVWAANPEVSDYPQSYYLKFEDHKFHHGMWKAWKERKEKWVYTIEGSEKEIYQEYLFNETEFKRFSKKAQKEFKGLKKWVASFTFSSFGGLQTVGEKPLSEENLAILARFGKVFDLTYTRFNDLQKAEAQAREAQIEMALEKVRSRTMAMQHSDELPQVANTLFLEVQGLGIPSWSCGFNVLSKDKTTSQSWMSSEGEIQKPFNLVFKKEASFIEMYNFFKSDATFLIQELDGKAIERHYNYLKSLPGLDTIFGELEKNNIPLPTYQINHLCKFNQGYLLFITYEKVPEAHNIFKRFTKVFEQTYTRFLDLQKSEAQARESQIQLALERVRAKTMAMQHSDELREVVLEIYQQLQILDFETQACNIIIIDKETKDMHYWVTGFTQDLYPESYHVPNLDHPFIQSQINAWQDNITYQVFTLEGKEKKAFDKLFFSETDFKNTPKEAQDMMKSLKSIFLSTAFSSSGLLQVIGQKALNEEMAIILQRFAKVFNQTYTRFLDLQKAEAQAREAQIEAALERVRSRSLAMHKPNELTEVVKVIVEKLTELGVILDANGITLCTYFPDSKNVLHWIASPDFSHVGKYLLPYFDHVIFKDTWQSKEQGDTYFSKAYSIKEKNSFFKHAFEHSDYKHFPEEFKQWIFKNDKHILSFAWQKNSAILIPSNTGVLPTEHEKDILIRFSKVFEQAYIRFMDLQKAEAQTRQAQINLAVERVRAKALAMHKSEEIIEVVAKLKDEVMGLDIPNVVAASIFLKEGEDKVRMWDLSSLERSDQGYLAITDITFKLKKIDPHLYIKRVWENTKDYFVDIQNSKDLKRIIEFMYENNQLEIAKEVEDYTKATDLKQLFHASKRLDKGKLCIDLLEPPPEEMEAILTKMGAAFDLAYKRFEDLQKAEAQAREAQIETALERVRSRSMAMHNSEELKEVIQVVYDQFVQLNINIEHAGFILDYKDNDDMHIWLADHNAVFPKIVLPYFDCAHWNSFIEAKKKGNNFFTNQLGFEEKNKFYKDLFEFIPDLPEETKTTYFKFDGLAISTVLLDNVGLYIENYSGTPFSDEENEILMRFGKVFQQTYTRFQDLQKAEAQTREAQIETALEKVRSRTMAMQHSNELPEAANNLFLQVQALGIPAWSAGYCIWEDKQKTAWCNMSSEGEIQKGFSLPTIGEGYNFYKPFKNNEAFHVAELGGEKLVKHYDFMKKLPIVGEILEGFDEKGIALPTFQIFHIVYFTHGYLPYVYNL